MSVLERPGALGTAARAVQATRPVVLGVTWTLVLLGVASAGPAPWPRTLLALAAATAFHAAVYTWNDVADLAVDRTDPRRARSPLVRGTLSVRAVLVGGCVAAVVAVLLVAPAGAGAALAMVVALALLGAYDAWGKRTRVPPLLDLVQGVGWAALVWCGAAVAGTPSTATAWLALYVVVSIMLVNGVVGAGRDLVNDLRHGARTTAWLLGCRAVSGRPVLTRAFGRWAATLQVACTGVLVAAAATGDGPGPVQARLTVVAVVLAGGTVAGAALAAALRHAERRRTAWTAGLGHILLMLALPVALVADRADAGVLVLLGVLLVAPWAGDPWVRTRVAATVRPARPVGHRAVPR